MDLNNRVYPLDLIDIVYHAPAPITVGGYKIKNLHDDRYLNFLVNGFVCASCGLRGMYVKVDHNIQFGNHLNVYGIAANGKEVQLTKDHIYPRSCGGLDNIKNYQVLCEMCNVKKATISPVTPVEALRRGYATTKSIQRAVKQGHPDALNVKVKK